MKLVGPLVDTPDNTAKKPPEGRFDPEDVRNSTLNGKEVRTGRPDA